MELSLFDRAINYFRKRIIRKLRKSSIYPKLYKSFWHFYFSNKKTNVSESHYFSSIPNPSAGIGHQLANWNAGYWFSKYFNLKFAHIPFTPISWDNFLGFGENETKVAELVERGFKKVKLPLFDENNQAEVELIEKIIHSYSFPKIIFITEQDQFYKDQFGVMEIIKEKFHKSIARQKDHFYYSKDNFNIAVHIRRGDIVSGQLSNENHQMRWQNNTYYENILVTILTELPTSKPKSIYIFSQGNPTDYSEFQKFQNIHLCLDMDPEESFLHMVYADILITSKSSFSYKPALLNNGLKICPREFWHSYPQSEDWIIAEEDGVLSITEMKKLTSFL